MRAFLRRVVPERCGCGRPATNDGFLCDQCRAGLAAQADRSQDDEFAQQHELAAKLNSLSEKEWNRVPILGLPSRLLDGTPSRLL